MSHIVWNTGNIALQMDEAALDGPADDKGRAVPRPRYSVVLGLCGVARAAEIVRRIVARHRGIMEWLSGNQPLHATRLHLRVRTERIDDMVTAFEAAGFDVVRVVTSGR